jgi:hypothetical protein
MTSRQLSTFTSSMTGPYAPEVVLANCSVADVPVERKVNPFLTYPMLGRVLPVMSKEKFCAACPLTRTCPVLTVGPPITSPASA